MFTGIIEEIGEITSIQPIGTGKKISIKAKRILEGLKVEDSVSISGACQTVVDISGNTFRVEAVGDTLQKTTLGKLMSGSKVNLERALTLNTRLGGHLVTGHVNGVGRINRIMHQGDHWFYLIQINDDIKKYCVPEGAITVDGVSLTIAEMNGNEIRISLIPYTNKHTVFQYYQPGSVVNIEVDILAKYLESLIEAKNPGKGLAFNFKSLSEWGY